MQQVVSEALTAALETVAGEELGVLVETTATNITPIHV
jgi:hypothetical protein